MKARMLERENAAKLAQLVYELLRFGKIRDRHLEALTEFEYLKSLTEFEQSSIELVRPPNPGHGYAIAVLFADGRDVVIRFEEAGGK
jgi:hypothetical protein